MFLLTLITGISSRCLSFAMPTSQPLPENVAKADLIVVGEVVNYTQDVNYVLPKPSRSIIINGQKHDIYSGIDGFVIANTLTPPGYYQFKIITVVKGQPMGTLRVKLPAILSVIYDGAALKVEPGMKCLLLLHLDTGSIAEPVDPNLPIIPLSNSSTTKRINDHNQGGVYERVVDLVLASLTDPIIRQANTFLLRNVVNTKMVVALVPYIDDSNLKVRDNVLYSLAANQQVAAIPRIEQLTQQANQAQIGVACPIALSFYKNVEARPYLLPLLFSSDYYIRLNTMFAIDHLANRTTIPYLLLAVRDPDEQNIVSQSAYGLLHQLNPSLGEAFGNDYFAQHRAVETKKLFAWWSDELLGKHLKPGEHPAIPAELPNTPALLNPLLFIPDAPTRRAAADKLAHLGDKSSIPYCVLALQDPDTEVAFTAYETLHRLIPALGNPRTRAFFDSNPAAISQPIYDWWRDELLGKHLPK